MITASSSHPLLLTGRAAHGLVEAQLKWIQRMKDLLLCVHVVAKTLNLEISRYHLADYVKELDLSACRTCSTIIFPHSTNQIIVFWRRRCCCRRPCLSSLSDKKGDRQGKSVLEAAAFPVTRS